MKKFLAILAILALCLVAVIAVVVVSKLRSSQVGFLLVKEYGDVSYRLENDTRVLTESEVELPSGTTVITGNGNAHVILPSNSMISLDTNTEVMIEFSDKSIEINQLIGNTWHRVESLTGSKSYQVQTPNVIAAVRGTVFGVETGVEDSAVFVEDSAVDVSDYEIESGKIKLLDTKNLLVGQYLEYTSDGQFSDPQDIPTRLHENSWYRKNKILDENIELGDTRMMRERLLELFHNNMELRELIPQQFRQEFDGRFGSRSNDFSPDTDSSEDIFDPGAVYGGLLGGELSSSSCEELTGADFDESITVLQGLSEAYPSATQYIEVLKRMKMYCQDGMLDMAELNGLQDVWGGDLQNSEENVARPTNREFELAINKEIEYWLKLEIGASTCQKYTDRSVESILASLTAIETQYGVEPRAAEENRTNIQKVKLACADGSLTQVEIDKIFPPETTVIL